jgi:hypothetical protein
MFPVIPQIKIEFSEKTEEIRLLPVFMRTASNTWMSHGKISHTGIKTLRQIICPEQLRKPSAPVVKGFGFPDYNA